MAITVASRIGLADETAKSTYTNASQALAADAVQLLTVLVFDSSVDPPQPTVTGGGRTWVSVATAVDTSNHFRITLFRAMGSATSDAITIDFAGDTQDMCFAILNEASGVDLGGTNGSEAVVQANAAVGTFSLGLSVSLNAFADGGNGTYGACFNTAAAGPISAGDGFSLVTEDQYGTTKRAASEFKSANDTTVDFSWGTNAAPWGVAAELKPVGGGGAALRINLAEPIAGGATF